jgi:hypothetical protein
MSEKVNGTGHWELCECGKLAKFFCRSFSVKPISFCLFHKDASQETTEDKK